jgi:hypothetical protein
MNLSSRVKLLKVKDHSAANTTDVTSDEVDTAGYDGVMFVTSFGTAATDNTLKAQQDIVTGMASAADLLATSVTSGASDEDVWIDIYRPQERFVRVVAERGTSSTLESIWAILYNPRSMPVDNATTGTIIGEFHQSPAEGTA